MEHHIIKLESIGRGLWRVTLERRGERLVNTVEASTAGEAWRKALAAG